MSNSVKTATIVNNSSEVAPTKRTLEIIKELSSVDYLLDYKLRNMIEVLRDNIENLHTEINEEEPREVLLIRSNKVTALFEMLVDLLPKSPDYFEKVQILSKGLLSKKSA